ncbi:MAG: phosphatidylglycerophosphatase A [Bacteroidota bacterium]
MNDTTQQQNNPQQEKPKVDLITKFIGSGFFTGYTPFAPGTAGSALGLAFFFIPGFMDLHVLVPCTFVLFLIGGLAAGKMEELYGQDPGIVTVDEIVGMWLSVWFIPFTFLNITLAFIIFRVLDILKPYPAAYFDKRTGGWNIMMDDVIAAVYTNAIIQIVLRVKLF